MVSEPIYPTSFASIDVTCHNLVEHKRNQYEYRCGNDDFFIPKTSRQVIVAIDPSKSNTAMVIGDLAGTVFYIYEISGAGKHRSNEDFCFLLCELLGKLLRGLNIAFFAQEKVILPKNSYRSMVYLNEIRTNLNNFARATLGLNPLEINNSAWKSAILPDGYRGKGEKGSHRWLRERYPAFFDVSDDVTDAICIYLYVKYAYGNKVPVHCNCIESTDLPFSTALVEEDCVDRARMEEFKFNPAFSLKENAKFFVNRRATTGFSLVPSGKINAVELYQHQCALRYQTDVDRIYLLVRRN